jgi:hypothetical protein
MECSCDRALQCEAGNKRKLHESMQRIGYKAYTRIELRVEARSAKIERTELDDQRI